MTRGNMRTNLILIVAAGALGVAGIVWPVVDRVLFAAVTLSLLGGAVAVLGYVAWAGWTELLLGHRRPDGSRRERVRR
jgi:hypothetical protein